MRYAILRTQKLKDRTSIRRSFRHAFREQNTPNANIDLSNRNSHIGANSSEQAMAKLNERLPDKIRKNGVLAIEYLITASPEIMNDKTRNEQDKYFESSLEWLRQRHGHENVVYAGIHRDETTPHMYAYVVPLDDKGKLNCRAFLGGSKALSQMQTDFAREVGLRHGLERGIEGSKAKHQRVKEFYTHINQPSVNFEDIQEKLVMPKTNMFESKENFARRAVDEILNDISPLILTMSDQIKLNDILKKKNTQLSNDVDVKQQLINSWSNKATKLASEQQKLFSGLTKEQKDEIKKEISSKQRENKVIRQKEKQKENDNDIEI